MVAASKMSNFNKKVIKTASKSPAPSVGDKAIIGKKSIGKPTAEKPSRTGTKKGNADSGKGKLIFTFDDMADRFEMMEEKMCDRFAQFEADMVIFREKMDEIVSSIGNRDANETECVQSMVAKMDEVTTGGAAFKEEMVKAKEEISELLIGISGKIKDQSGMAGAMESMATDVGKIEALVGKMGGSVSKIDTLPLRIDEMEERTVVALESSTAGLTRKVEETQNTMKKMFGKLATFLNAALGYDDNDIEKMKVH